MTEQELRALRPKLDRFLDKFLFCCEHSQTFDHLSTYVHGLLSDLKRKTCEPIALAADTPPRTLQQFLTKSAWDCSQIRAHLQQHTATLLPTLPNIDDLGTIGLIDETSAAKKGAKTPGVKRQHLGCLGKIDNGIVTVHLGVAKGPFKSLIDFDLFLPKDWSEDRTRCRQAGIPDDVVYRPKWQIALEQLDRAKTNGVVLDWLTFDEGYGKSPGFLAGLGQQRFVGEVPKSFSCMAAHKNGKVPSEELDARRAEDVVRTASAFRCQPWQILRLSRQTNADQVWRVKAAQVWLHSKEGWSGRTYWLIWACNDETGEEKFFLSNAAADTKVEVLVRVAFSRWHVEHSFRICKQELGFTHFEGQSYVALLRHLCLSTVAMAFVAEHTQRLRKSNPRATMEQVCRNLRVLCRNWLQRQRNTSELTHLSWLDEYYQARNDAAQRSKKKRTPVVRARKKPRPPKNPPDPKKESQSLSVAKIA
jgi:SRSO17 transposase